jgi:hypothetical protein
MVLGDKSELEASAQVVQDALDLGGHLLVGLTPAPAIGFIQGPEDNKAWPVTVTPDNILQLEPGCPTAQVDASGPVP